MECTAALSVLFLSRTAEYSVPLFYYVSISEVSAFSPFVHSEDRSLLNLVCEKNQISYRWKRNIKGKTKVAEILQKWKMAIFHKKEARA